MHRLSVLLLALLFTGCAIPVVHHPTPLQADMATVQRHVEHTLLRARVPKTTAVEITAYAVTFGVPGTGHYVLPPILYPGIAGAVAYNRARTESRGVSHQIFFEAIGQVEVYKNGYVFVKNTGGHLITKVLFASLDDAKLFADALLALKHAPVDVQKENVPDQGYIGKSAGEIILTWGHPSFVYGDYRDPIYVYIVQDKAMVFIFKARSCVYTDVMALEEVEEFLGMHREREKKSFNNPQLVY
jgi:hypothetical protein